MVKMLCGILVVDFSDLETEASNLADEILRNKPEIGYLTISNALQWRLQYGKIIEKAGEVNGINKLV